MAQHIHPKTPEITILDEVWVKDFTAEAALIFRAQLTFQSGKDPTKPIIVYINSHGGYVDALASMISTMDEVTNPIITVAHGTAVSCGAIFLSHGDLRLCTPHSTIMVHEVSSGTYGDVHDMLNDVEETKRLNEYFIGLMAKNCGFKSYAEFRKWMKEQDGRDRYMSAEQAVKFGIVDAVGTPSIATTVIHQVNIDKSAASADALPLAAPSKKSDSKKSTKRRRANVR